MKYLLLLLVIPRKALSWTLQNGCKSLDDLVRKRSQFTSHFAKRNDINQASLIVTRLNAKLGDIEIESGVIETDSGESYLIEQHTRETNGLKLHTVEAGPTAGEMVILLHGFPEFWYGWKAQIPFLVRKGYRVVVPDQRGYNLSDKPKNVEDYNIEELAKDVCGLVKLFGKDKVFLVGHDWGAVISWWLAAHYPQYFYRVAILNVPHPDALKRLLLSNMGQVLKSWYIGFFQLPAIPEWYLPISNIFGRSSLETTFTPKDLQQYENSWSQPGAKTGMINWYRAFVRQQPRFRVNKIQLQICIIWGTQDIALSREGATMSLEYCEQAELHFLEDATHWVQHDAPHQVNQLIADFLASEKYDTPVQEQVPVD